MKKSKEHLNIDLDFLGEKESIEKSHKTEDKPNYVPTPGLNIKNRTGKKAQPDFKINWSTVSTVVFILFFIGVSIYSSGSNNSNTAVPVSGTNTDTNNNNSLGQLKSPTLNVNKAIADEDVIVDEYSCSTSHSREARALTTDETEQQIDGANNSLKIREGEIKSLKDEIDNIDVNDYSEQWEIDSYNEKVDDYNSKRTVYNRDLKSLSSRIEKFNSQVKIYNDYLDNNCTKRN